MFSHGCIRIEKPLELAEYLLKSDTAWNMTSLKTAIDTVTDKKILLPNPIEVYICYWTAWVEPTGELICRPDIYGNDKRLTHEMNFTSHSTKK
ncbi:MAG TPA: peptidoglycan-binding protein, partial [Bacteroidia bacterium]|nr:peptidoglycan-binding protein [Bacteroidia bacterium]